MRLAVCILAKDEAGTIARMLEQLGRQSLLARSDVAIDVHVVANGCTDDTAARASAAAAELAGTNARLTVHDLKQGGKSRSWNRAVHELIDPSVDMLLFADSDISFSSENVLEEVLQRLQAAPSAAACTGYPVKDIALKDRKNLLDLLSLAISRQSRGAASINGSLYLVQAEALREVWLPDETPGEDGFLNAMLMTYGFTREPQLGRVITMDSPTHYYKAHRAADFVLHERRMIVGTMINRWIFEHLWSLKLKTPAGPLIQQWNGERPDWVDRLIAAKTAGSAWVIPNAVLFGRLRIRPEKAPWSWPFRFAFGTVATLLTVPPAIAANRRLKQFGAAQTW